MQFKQASLGKVSFIYYLTLFMIGNFSCFCCHLLTFFLTIRVSNGLDQDTLIVFLKEFFEKVNFEKSQQTTNYPACKELKKSHELALMQ